MCCGWCLSVASLETDGLKTGVLPDVPQWCLPWLAAYNPAALFKLERNLTLCHSSRSTGPISVLHAEIRSFDCVGMFGPVVGSVKAALHNFANKIGCNLSSSVWPY